MCGRARCTLRPDDVPRASHRHGVPARFLHLDRYRPSYNVAPGTYMPVLRRDNDGIAVHCMKWGLVPSFTKKTDKPDFFKMFNARSESVAEKASFRRLLPKNRCLVAVDGFYEWKKEGSKKQPYYIHFNDRRPLVFAALFDSWQNSGGETLDTFTILTTTSSSALDWLHDRMPVILNDKESVDTWLDGPSTSNLKPLLVPYENSDLVWYPVTSAIGKLCFDGPECIQQIPLKASQNSLISKFFSAKHPNTDEGDRETKSTDADTPVDLKEKPKVEGYDEAFFSNCNKKSEELDEEIDKSNEAKNLGFQNIAKAEPLMEDNSAVVLRLESVKNEVEEDTKGKSIKTALSKVTDESNLDLQRISNEEHETQGHRFTKIEAMNQVEFPDNATQEKSGNENETVITFETTKGSDVVRLAEKSSGRSEKKREYEVFSAPEKPKKHSEMLQDVQSCGKQGKKQGKGKSNIKKSKQTQSTLHFFFDGK
ncbi:hypothetical protein EUTSA_v10003450mg [Eutrema salsugineum]|uniref:Embryonic stem cell-specific 5-hydroxymethylcytosine-binding protein n=1 Tax=Eutrema salsugineum TaxID=72664 RepID=V4NEP1_EUTSA|nr:putative peptidase YMR114C isoform X2 [Eutrema salsugineum]ESQ44531.1 hypothetical protein EUTSA_v10003450mg [Eutrema salsugineum]